LRHPLLRPLRRKTSSSSTRRPASRSSGAFAAATARRRYQQLAVPGDLMSFRRFVSMRRSRLTSPSGGWIALITDRASDKSLPLTAVVLCLAVHRGSQVGGGVVSPDHRLAVGQIPYAQGGVPGPVVGLATPRSICSIVSCAVCGRIRGASQGRRPLPRAASAASCHAVRPTQNRYRPQYGYRPIPI
jgi:hypothetical protein